MKRVFHRLLCWMLVLAIAGLPAAAAAGLEDGHAGHAMHGAQSKGGAHHAAYHGHDSAGVHHQAHGDHDAHSGGWHGPHHAHERQPDYPQASEPAGAPDCADTTCLAACAACGHCQGMPSIIGMSILPPVLQVAGLHSFQSGPPAAALYRPPILS